MQYETIGIISVCFNFVIYNNMNNDLENNEKQNIPKYPADKLIKLNVLQSQIYMQIGLFKIPIQS